MLVFTSMIMGQIKVHLKLKYCFRLNRSLHLFETHLFELNLDFLIGYKSYEI